MSALLQLSPGLDHLVNAGFVGVQLLLKVLVFLNFALQVGWVQIAVISGDLQFLVDPPLGLVAVSLKLLELVGILEHSLSDGALLQELRPSLEEKRSPLSHILRGVVLTLDQLSGELVQCPDLFLLGGEGLLKVLVFFNKGLHRVQGVPEVLRVK